MCQANAVLRPSLRTHTIGGSVATSLTGLDLVALLHANNNTFSSFVESNRVKLKTSCTVILSLTSKVPQGWLTLCCVCNR